MATAADVRDRLVELLRSTSSLLSVSRDLDEVLEAITRGLTERIEDSACSVWLYRRDDDCDECAGNGAAGSEMALHLATVAGTRPEVVVHTHRIPLGPLPRGPRRPASVPGPARRSAPSDGERHGPAVSKSHSTSRATKTTSSSSRSSTGAAWARRSIRCWSGTSWWARSGSGAPAADRRRDGGLELFAGQAAIAIEGAELFAALERANLVLEAENSEAARRGERRRHRRPDRGEPALLEVLRQAARWRRPTPPS